MFYDILRLLFIEGGIKMDKNDNKNNLEGDREHSRPSAFEVFGGIVGGAMIAFSAIPVAWLSTNKNEISLENDQTLNNELDFLMEGFSPNSWDIDLGDQLEEYLGVSLDSSKKQRLNAIAEELGDIKAVAEEKMDISTFEKTQGKEAFRKINEFMRENILEDNDIEENIYLSFEFGKDYGWVVADDYYQIFDTVLNQYASSYEILNSYRQDVDRREYEGIVNGVLKTCLCDIVLDENSDQAKVVVPKEVKELVKKR